MAPAPKMVAPERERKNCASMFGMNISKNANIAYGYTIKKRAKCMNSAAIPNAQRLRLENPGVAICT
jgi:hypothetical protein